MVTLRNIGVMGKKAIAHQILDKLSNQDRILLLKNNIVFPRGVRKRSRMHKIVEKIIELTGVDLGG